MKNVKVYAVCISDMGYGFLARSGNINSFHECFFEASGITEATKKARLYIRQWQLAGEKIDYIREVSANELQEAIATDRKYDAEKYSPFCFAKIFT